MPVNANLTTQLVAGRSYFRVTPVTYLASTITKNKRVVNGVGAMKNQVGSRYAFAATCTVYLTEDVTTTLAETMFYFHREVLTALDAQHILGVLPSFDKKYVLWEITFKQDVQDFADLTVANAPAFGVYPALMLNPSQDYHHLRAARSRMQAHGYNGLVAPSSRAIANANMVVVFSDQSKNVAAIQAHPVDYRLIRAGGPPTAAFANHATDLMAYGSGEVRFHGAAVAGFAANTWQVVPFNH